MSFAELDSPANAGASASGSSIGVSRTYTGGERAVVWVTVGGATTITVTDGTNTYSAVGSQLVANSGDVQQLFECLSCTAGTYTVTANFGTANAFRGIAVHRFSGLTGAGQAIGLAQTVPGTQADRLSSSVNLIPASAPGMVLGIATDFNGGTISTGANFDLSAVYANVDSANGSYTVSETQRLTSTAAVAATFTASVGSSNFAALAYWAAETVAAPAATVNYKLPGVRKHLRAWASRWTQAGIGGLKSTQRGWFSRDIVLPIAAGAPSHATSGSLAAQDASIAGTAAHKTLHATSGALASQAATISGAAQHQHATTGALSAQAASVAGTAAHFTLHATSGALSSQAAAISGSAAHQHAATGALSSGAATISGTATHTVPGATHATSGALAADAATVNGTAAHLTLHTTSGTLAAQASTVSGVAAHPHVSSGALAAQDAAISGSAAHTAPGVHATSGALQAGDATISAEALLAPIAPAASTGQDGASPYKKWRYYSDDQPEEEPRKPEPAPPVVEVAPAPTPKPRAPVSAGELLRTVQAMAEQRRAIAAELAEQESMQRQAVAKASQTRATAERQAAATIVAAQAEALEQEIEDDDQEAIALAVSLLDL